MQEITLTQLYDMWKSHLLKEDIFYFKQNGLTRNKRKTITFGEYHTWILKEGKYRII